MPAVNAIANTPQNVTRAGARSTFAPPAIAAIRAAPRERGRSTHDCDLAAPNRIAFSIRLWV